MKVLHWAAFVLVVVGGVNWGLVGLFNIDLVATLFGAMPMVAKTVYVLVGLSAVYMIFPCPKRCKMCVPSQSE